MNEQINYMEELAVINCAYVNMKVIQALLRQNPPADGSSEKWHIGMELAIDELGRRKDQIEVQLRTLERQEKAKKKTNPKAKKQVKDAE